MAVRLSSQWNGVNVSKAILYITWYFTGSQWSCCNIAVLCSDLRECMKMHTAMFCTSCGLCRDESATPAIRALQWSKHEVTKAWMRSLQCLVWENLEHQRCYAKGLEQIKLNTIHRIVYDNVPAYLWENITFLSQQHNIATCYSQMALTLPWVKSYGQWSFCYIAAKLWNSVALHIGMVPSLWRFTRCPHSGYMTIQTD